MPGGNKPARNLSEVLDMKNVCRIFYILAGAPAVNLAIMLRRTGGGHGGPFQGFSWFHRSRTATGKLFQFV
jgi:hypothetical protein